MDKNLAGVSAIISAVLQNQHAVTRILPKVPVACLLEQSPSCIHVVVISTAPFGYPAGCCKLPEDSRIYFTSWSGRRFKPS
jgi:hypothetical protein